MRCETFKNSNVCSEIACSLQPRNTVVANERLFEVQLYELGELFEMREALIRYLGLVEDQLLKLRQDYYADVWEQVRGIVLASPSHYPKRLACIAVPSRTTEAKSFHISNNL